MPSATAPVLTAGVSGQIIHDGGNIGIFERVSHEGTLQIGDSWGIREGRGSSGLSISSRAGSCTLSAIELKRAANIEDDSLMLLVYDENDGSIIGQTDFDIDLLLGVGPKIGLATPIPIPAGVNVSFRFVTGRSQTDLDPAVIGLYFTPTRNTLPLPPSNARLLGYGAREDTSFGFWGSAVGRLTPESVFGADGYPRIDIGFEGGDTTVMEIWAVGMRAGRGHYDSSATFGIYNHIDDFNLGTFTTTGKNWAQMLTTPLTYPVGSSIGFHCESVNGHPLDDVVLVAWVREIVTQTADVYSTSHHLYVTDDLYVSN